MADVARPGVIVCAYTLERWADLCAAVESLGLQTLAPARTVIVVDHNAELLERARDRFGSSAVPNSAEPGLSGARNSGVAVSTEHVIAFLDDDAIADTGWLEALAGAFAEPRVAAAGGRVEPLWEAGRPRWCPEEFDWVFGCTYRGMPDTRQRVRNVIGANMAFRREALLDAGGFRAGLGRTRDGAMGGEETDACIRLTQRDPRAVVLYEPAAVVRHRVPASRATWSYFRTRCMAEGVSKARLSRAVGSRDGLASERRHAAAVLPRGFATGLGDTLRGRDPWGAARAAAIAGGFAATAAGYVVGSIGDGAGPQSPPSA